MLLVNSNSIVQLYAYGTNSHTIRVRLYHMRIRVRYVPYAYGMKYAYGTQQCHVPKTMSPISYRFNITWLHVIIVKEYLGGFVIITVIVRSIRGFW